MDSRKGLVGAAWLAVGFMIGAVQASEPVQPRPQVTPQPLPEAEVTIRKDGNDQIKEWRVNGKVLAIKVEPKGGVSYYLVDPDGDGVFETRDDFENDGMVAQWVLFRF